ncbi:pRL2-23 [Streptomyces marincola]
MDTVIAVAGTLAGAVVTGLLQHRATARTERAARREREEREWLASVTELARAVSAHRAAMWALRHAELTGASAERVDVLRDASHTTRGAVTAPAVMLRLLTSSARLRAAADEAVHATYGMRDAVSVADLDARRQRALGAHDAFVDAAAVAARPGGERR